MCAAALPSAPRQFGTGARSSFLAASSRWPARTPQGTKERARRGADMRRAMTSGNAAPVAVTPAPLPQPVRQRIFLYLGLLIMLLAFGAPFGGLIDIPISFFLKNKLHLEANEVAVFRLVSAI